MTDWAARQNSDGGWAYSRGCSWAEPTAFVLLAQSTGSPDRESSLQGRKFFASLARHDGGWSPQPGVEESTWVTALAALLPEALISEQQRRQAISWLKDKTGRDSSLLYRVRRRLAGDKEELPEGWPWFPGASAWVIPTSLGILAFERALRRGASDRDALEDRIAQGKKFLLARQCEDGGWNYGSIHVPGRDGDSYPETTGVALLALNGVPPSSQLEKAKTAARRHFSECRTAEGIAWLRMGMAAQGGTITSAFDPVCRTNMDDALMALAAAPRNPLLA
jgi:hypothetical protein